jgi:hypothetical protein
MSDSPEPLTDAQLGEVQAAMRPCSRCGVVTDQYYRDRGKPTGFKYHCKACTTREERRRAESRRQSAHLRNQRPEVKRQNIQRRTAYTKQDPKRFARGALASAVYRGTIKKPTACERCQQEFPRERIQGHHHNGYDRAHYFDVQWLCQRCHNYVEGYSVEAKTAAQGEC